MHSLEPSPFMEFDNKTIIPPQKIHLIPPLANTNPYPCASTYYSTTYSHPAGNTRAACAAYHVKIQRILMKELVSRKLLKKQFLHRPIK